MLILERYSNIEIITIFHMNVVSVVYMMSLYLVKGKFLIHLRLEKQ